ncbi:tail length tape measure protein [Leptolyngbya sp. 'hensonii']|uniref:lytic transglycosylase domain-containing protein n=1 Tax=Leptolyngbya sp. 'hensonii' TaxID=1922337 RepID=UPI00094F7B4A|nr:transglycosylase SLT domain-containing protein [Leptolyngbya sp. 'hensonii']OLP18937.1 tail length tape measure protein [Leptolyngbya sp. 'hensonii']
MLKRYIKERKAQLYLATAAGVSALLLGGLFSATRLGSVAGPWPQFGQTQPSQVNPVQPDNNEFDPTIAPLVLLPPQQRAAQLTTLVQGAVSPTRNRARYLLASDWMQQRQPDQALVLLQNLDQDYPEIAPYVVLQQARAYELKGDRAKARESWQVLIQRYPDLPVVTEALFALGRTEPKYWDQAIERFPAHPRSIEIVRARLRKNPNQPQLLLLLVKHAFYAPGIVQVTDRLVKQHALRLTAEDWEAVAFAYWENVEYGKAGLAYTQAPTTPKNLYRAARGLQLGGKTTEAATLYQQQIRQFPMAPETGTALLRLAKLTPTPAAGLPYLDQVTNQFPDRAAEALLAKSKLLDKLDSGKSASEARQMILTQYPNSKATAELRWEQARKQAQAGHYLEAWKWAQPITNQSPRHPIAAEAGFWIGKWALHLGRQQEARAAFEYVLTHHPESYYAWRAANQLGLDVGDFTTVRQLAPSVGQAFVRSKLPAGSALLNELYQLGQDWDAWTLWQVEFTSFKQPTVAEQFTDGLMRLGVGDNLDGLYMLTSLSDRESPDEQEQYAALKRHYAYWQGLYPFPYRDTIAAWSQERGLNPMLVTALIRQESRFEQGIRSSAGATGLMQVMPDTADWVAGKIRLKNYKLSDPIDNINLGTWYLDYTHREYQDNSLLAVASYNAGPGNVADWISKQGLHDPDEFIEAIPFDETRDYVKSVFGNYWNYLRLYDPATAQKLTKYSTHR